MHCISIVPSFLNSSEFFDLCYFAWTAHFPDVVSSSMGLKPEKLGDCQGSPTHSQNNQKCSLSPWTYQITSQTTFTFIHAIQLTTQDSGATSSWKPSLTSWLAQLTSSKLLKFSELAPGILRHPWLEALHFLICLLHCTSLPHSPVLPKCVIHCWIKWDNLINR